jgi:hypothetical protein
LSAGGRLSEHGKVLVLEAEHAVGYHASGRSAASNAWTAKAGAFWSEIRALRPPFW